MGVLSESEEEVLPAHDAFSEEQPRFLRVKPELFRPPRPTLGSDDDMSEEDMEAAFCLDKEFDDFGFALAPPGDALGETTRSYAQWFMPKAARRRQRFEARRSKLKEPGAWGELPPPQLKRLLRKGVPDEHRPEVWWSVLGCEERRQRSSAGYSDYLSADLGVKTAEEIERDLQRTFPSHSSFRAAAGRSQLRNVLRAYACYNPRIRYCQGLNFVAALLLVVFQDEERAFWAMAASIERLDVEGYYTEGMTLLRGDMQVLASVMLQKCPKVYRVFQENEIQLTSICSEWFITWFAKCLPVQTTMRVWDTLFLEGFKVLFRVAIGIFKLAEAEVLRCAGFDAIMLSAKHWPRRMIEHNELLKASFNGVPMLRRRDIFKAREAAVRCLVVEDEERARRAAACGRAAAEAREAAAARRAAEAAAAAAEAAGAAQGREACLDTI